MWLYKFYEKKCNYKKFYGFKMYVYIISYNTKTFKGVMVQKIKKLKVLYDK